MPYMLDFGFSRSLMTANNEDMKFDEKRNVVYIVAIVGLTVWNN